MALAPSGALRREFRYRVGAEFQRRQAQRYREEQERKERREQAESKADDLVDMAIAALSATEVTLFKAELNTYDEATIIALQENEAALAIVRDKLDDLLARAHVLPDGTRVFKTEDGLNVFDENGVEMDKSVIEPDAISDDRPKWEIFRAVLDDKDALEAGRADLLNYQADLDEARERLDSGELTRDEFDELRTGLSKTMPVGVRNQIDAKDMAPNAKFPTEVAEVDLDLDLSGDMVPTGMTPPQM